MTAGTNITISGGTISATDTTYSAGTGIVINGTNIGVDTDTVQSKLTFDDIPTATSNNPVKSSGIYTALQGKQDKLTAGNNISIIDNVISVNSEQATSGQVLTADGNGGASWQNASGGSKKYMHSVKIVGVALNKHIEVYFNKLSRISESATDLLSLQKLIGDDVLVASGYFVASIKINAGVTSVTQTCNLPVLTISKTTIAINRLVPADTNNLLISLPNDVMNLAVTDNVTIY